MKNKKLLVALLLCHAASVALPACGPPIHYDGLGPAPDKTAAMPFGAALLGSRETREARSGSLENVLDRCACGRIAGILR
jgi:hypothetical protein